MLRAVLAVIAGYVAMFLFVMVTFSVAYVGMGVDRTFRPGSYDPSTLWLVTSFALGLVGAMAGGLVCAAIARAARPVMALAGLVLVLGLLLAIPVLTADAVEPIPREGDLGTFEAMQNARQPGWVALLNPLVGAVGVMLGGRILGPGRGD